MDAICPFSAWLTVDDGPSADTPRKLDALESRGIKAIWFCRGEYIEQRPDVTIAIIQRGHVIGNHSWNHPSFSGMRLYKAMAQIQRTEDQIALSYARAGISRPIKVFRFPWGDKGAGTHLEREISIDTATRVLELQAMLRQFGFVQPTFEGVTLSRFPGYDLAADADTWYTFDAMEWALLSKKPRDGINSLDAVLARIDAHFLAKRTGLAPCSPREIVLVHDFEATAATFVPIIERIVSNGVQFLPPKFAVELSGKP